jgi:hypothetical protein
MTVPGYPVTSLRTIDLRLSSSPGFWPEPLIDSQDKVPPDYVFYAFIGCRSRRVSAGAGLQRERQRLLEQLPHAPEEAGAVRAVQDAVIADQ